jgi:hypothetical protein
MRLFDKIKEMSVTELAEFLLENGTKLIDKADSYICKQCKQKNPNRSCKYDDDVCNYGDWSDADLIREWLLQEVEMSIDERIKYAEQKRDEAFINDSVQSIIYWDGYIAALKAIKEAENEQRKAD